MSDPHQRPLADDLSELERELVEAIHAGIFETPIWHHLLDRLKTISGAYYVSFAFRRGDAPINAVRVIHVGEGEPNARYELLEQLYSQAPLPYHQLKPGQVYALDDFLDRTDPVHNGYLAYLRDRSLNFVQVVRVVEPSGGSGWLGVSRRDGDFDPAFRTLLGRLAPHLSIAVRTLATIEQERIRASAASYAVRQLNYGWLSVDANGIVIDANNEAIDIFRATPGLSSISIRHKLDLPEKPRRILSETLRNFAAGSNTRTRAIHILDEPWMDILVAYMPFDPISGGWTPIATIYVRSPGVAGNDQCNQLMDLFALTRSEARLALALCRGKTLAEAATELKLTIETARHYSKRIFSKTATRSQTDLVRLILVSVISLA